jgi:cyanate lyase
VGRRGQKVGLSKEWVTAGCLGQMTFDKKQAATLGKIFGLPPDAVALLQVVPYKGSLPTAVPTDPLIYRFYELISVYGTTFKELIHEEFGDGIMSAIDFKMDLKREAEPARRRPGEHRHERQVPALQDLLTSSAAPALGAGRSIVHQRLLPLRRLRAGLPDQDHCHRPRLSGGRFQARGMHLLRRLRGRLQAQAPWSQRRPQIWPWSIKAQVASRLPAAARCGMPHLRRSLPGGGDPLQPAPGRAAPGGIDSAPATAAVPASRPARWRRSAWSDLRRKRRRSHADFR